MGRMRIIIIGPPGSGKGTRAKIVGRLYGVPVLTSGDMLREAAAEGTEHGKIAEEYMNRGDLVPDDIVIAIMEERLKREDTRKGFVLDGFPRSVKQAAALDRILGDIKAEIDVVLAVTAKPDTIVNRLTHRRSCPKCGSVYHLRDLPPKKVGICDECGGQLIQREDDKEEIIRRRFEVYERQTFPIIERYSTVGKFREVSGELDIEDIPAALEKILGKPEI